MCYREASDQQFDAFCEEIAQGQDKDMDPEVNSKAKDIQNVLSQLDEQKNKKAEDKPNVRKTPLGHSFLFLGLRIYFM